MQQGWIEWHNYEMRNAVCVTILIGILSSLIASFVFTGMTLLVNERSRRRRAKPFVGKYRMFGADGLLDLGGTVKIERKNWGENLMSTAPILTVVAEHGLGRAPGTEDWTGTVEVLGTSDTAGGYYTYPNRQGGALRFKLSRNEEQVTEYGTPFDNSKPFIRILKRG
jgi:hypothetical protein